MCSHQYVHPILSRRWLLPSIQDLFNNSSIAPYNRQVHFIQSPILQHSRRQRLQIVFCIFKKSTFTKTNLQINVTINASKTERSSVCRHADRVDEEWRMTRKLGSLLGEAEDVARRKQLANVAFRKLSTVWFRRSRISLPLRLRLYESFVVPVLIRLVFKCGSPHLNANANAQNDSNANANAQHLNQMQMQVRSI